MKLVLIALLLASLAARGEDDSDSRQPVVVKPKHDSIIARSLPHLIELAEEHSPNIQKAKGTFMIASLEYQNSRKAWLPSLDFQTTHGLEGTDPNSRTTPWASGLDLVLSESFYDNGASLTQYEKAKHKLERGKIEFEIARDAQLRDMVNAYYDWSASLEQREILENKRDLLRRQHGVLESQYKQGMKTKRDVLRIETEVRRLELAVIDSDNEVSLGFQKLASMVGLSREDLEKESIEGEVAKPYLKAEERNDELKAQSNRQAKVFQFKEKESALDTELVRRDYWPQLLLTGDVGYHNQDYLANSAATTWDANHSWDWSALVTLKYNLWDFGVRDRKVEIARINERLTVDQNQQALLDLGNELRAVTLQLRSFRENVKMTRELLVLEQQSYALQETEYRNGRATYLDLILNLNSLIDARSKFISSYFGLKKQQILYSFYHGDIYENIKQK